MSREYSTSLGGSRGFLGLYSRTTCVGRCSTSERCIWENSIWGCPKVQTWSMCSAFKPFVYRASCWPSPLKFINELNPEAKVLLERALMDANREREKNILKGISYSHISSPSHSDAGADGNLSEASGTELCCICFDNICTIEVQDCGHQMCAPCTLALCCHNKPNPTTSCITSPVCPFRRTNIAQLVVAKTKSDDDLEKDLNSSKLRRSRRLSNYSEGSRSFKGLSVIGSFGKMAGRMSGKVASDSSDWIDKP